MYNSLIFLRLYSVQWYNIEQEKKQKMCLDPITIFDIAIDFEHTIFAIPVVKITLLTVLFS